jgi:hypothetical protein
MFADITNYRMNGDWLFLTTATIVVDYIAILMTRYPQPNQIFKVGALNEWYDRFGIVAAICDVGSLLIGLGAARYIYTLAGFTGAFMFLVCIVGFQLVHDILFYLMIIRPTAKGQNEMIDVFKAYAAENGANILGADAAMLVSSAGIASALKALPAHYTVSLAIVTIYAMSYSFYARPAGVSSGKNQ